MIAKFEEHYSDAEIMKLNIHSETTKWKEELEFHLNELDFYYSLLTSKLVKGSHAEELENLLRELKNMKEDTKSHGQTLFDFKRKLEGMKECDDVQCENHYLQDHLLLKASLDKHFRNYRSIKAHLQNHIGKEMQRSFSDKF